MFPQRVFLSRAIALAAVAVLAPAAPAAAVIYTDPDWLPKRHPGSPLPDEVPPPPSGWRLGAAMTFPYTMAASLAYLWPGEPAAFKAGATWGILGDQRTIAGQFSDYRLYGALMYYLVPGAQGGPYVETGLNVARASGAVLPLDWPVVPHIGFGTNGYWSEKTAWDLTFSATAHGVMSLEGGLLF